jgi:hypothetical protein
MFRVRVSVRVRVNVWTSIRDWTSIWVYHIYIYISIN